jgi:CubicO group peptidase (beta-lactamase class C family)
MDGTIHQFNLMRRVAYDAAMQVPLDAWQVGPWNRWAYVHVDEVVDTAPVSRGDGPVAPLEQGDADLDDVLRPLVDTAYANGVAVVHQGRLVAELYGGEMTGTSLHLSQSVGKSVLGLLIGILGIETRELVTDYVPEVAESGYERATVRHLLDMTASIDFVENYEAFVRYDAACGWHPEVPDSPNTILEFLPTIGPATWRHGERFHYATPNTDLLGLVAERAGGLPLSELISRELWAPMGAEADAELTVDAAGTGAIGGGFCATLRDYARLGALVADGGRGIVPATWIEQLGDGDDTAWERRTVPNIGGDGYRNQWWSRDGFTMARGIHGQLIAANDKTVVTVLSSWPAALEPAHEQAQLQAVAGVRDRL